MESNAFKMPTGKSDIFFYHETSTTKLLLMLLIFINIIIFIRMGFKSKPSKALGYLAGSIIPISLASYLIFTDKIQLL